MADNGVALSQAKLAIIVKERDEQEERLTRPILTKRPPCEHLQAQWRRFYTPNYWSAHVCIQCNAVVRRDDYEESKL